MQSFFVSSTFKDMQGERDALHKAVLPRLREKAKEYGQNVQFIDLRWGISTEDMDNDEGASKIVDVCLEEIDNCKPYMIILLGERYGWMPDVSLLQNVMDKKQVPIEVYPMSITEMEIQYGMLRNSDKLDHCFFCMRNPLPVQDMPAELLEDMVCKTEEEKARLEKLKDHIRQTEGTRVLEYDLTWDWDKKELTGYDAFAESLSEALEELMKKEWGMAISQSWQERQWMDDQILQHTLTGCFYGRENDIHTAIQKLEDTQVYVIEAEGGSGKSAFISAMAKRIPNSHVIYCGNSSYCMNVEQLLQVLCSRVGISAGSMMPEYGSLEKWRDLWSAYAAMNRRYPITIFIDAIDQLYRDDALFQSLYLPREISDNLRIVITTTGAVRVSPQALSGIRYKKETLSVPTREERAFIIREMFRAEHKQIGKDIEDAILHNPCSQNMLALSIMVRRLTMLGEPDFREIQKLEKTMDGDTAIRTYLLSLVRSFAGNTYSLIDDYVEAVCKYLDGAQDGNRIVLCLIACLENGISRTELEELYDYILQSETLAKHPAWSTFWNDLRFSRMRYYLGPLLIQKSDGKIDFTHRLIRQSLRANHATLYCGYILQSYFDYGHASRDLIFENQFPLARQIWSKLKEDGEERSHFVRILDENIVPIIRRTGNRSVSDDYLEAQDGKEVLRILERSVLNDLAGEHRQQHLDIYCDMLQMAIEEGHGPANWLIWFFDRRIAQTVWDQGDTGKTMAIQIYLALISTYMKPEHKALRDGFNESASDSMCWIFYHTMRLYRLLVSSIQHGRVAGRSYNYTWDQLYEDGDKWFEHHIRLYPSDVKSMGRAVIFYRDHAWNLADTFGAAKMAKKAEALLDTFEKRVDISDECNWRLLIKLNYELAELYIKMHSNAIIHGKKYLALAQMKIEKAQKYFAMTPKNNRSITTELYLTIILAEVYKSTNRLKEGLEILWRCFEKYNSSEYVFTDAERGCYSELIMLTIQLLFRYKSVSVDGKTKYQMAKELLKHESGYIRANMNESFESRYNWGQILRLRAYCKQMGGHNYANDLAEAKDCFLELAEEQKKDNRGIATWRHDAKKALSEIAAMK